MRRARRTDANQAEIVAALRQAGCSVEVLSDVGRGVPDLLVGRANETRLLEVKMPGEPLSDDQFAWMQQWRGGMWIVSSVQDALIAVGLMKQRRPQTETLLESVGHD